MIRAIADTHTAIWYLYADVHLSPTARAFIEDAYVRGDTIGISAITFVEVVYLSEKGRIDQATFAGLLAELQRPAPTFVEIPVEWRIAEAMQLVARSQVPDMPDRIVAATAVHLGIPVISRDRKI